MTLPQVPQHVVAWEVSTLLLQILSMGSTIVRIVHRWRTKRMWWDDWIAFIPLSVDAFLVIIDWLAATAAGSSQSLLFSPWFGTFMYFTVIWVSRISLSLSIARIFPPKHACRRLAFALTVLFIVLYIPNVLMPIFECANQTIKWYRMPLIDCVKDRPAPSAAVFTSLAHFVAVILLIVTPLTMLWKIKLPKRERALILTLFSSSILSLFASTAFCVVWTLNTRFGSNSRMVIRMVAQIEAAIALLVCNLVVVTMMFYRILKRESILESDAISEPVDLLSIPPPQEETRGASEKESLTNVATNRANITVHEDRDAASALQQDSTTNISFTTIFEDSLQNSSLRSGSFSKIDTRSQSFENYDEDNSQNSSVSRFPAWSFSNKSTDSQFCS